MKKLLAISTCIDCTHKAGIVKPTSVIGATLYCRLTKEPLPDAETMKGVE